MTTNSQRVGGKDGGRDGEREESRWVGMKGVSEEGREGWVTLAAQHRSHGQGKRAGVCVCRTHVGVGGHVFCLSAISAQRRTKRRPGNCALTPSPHHAAPRRAVCGVMMVAAHFPLKCVRGRRHHSDSIPFSRPPFCLFHTACELEITNSSGGCGGGGCFWLAGWLPAAGNWAPCPPRPPQLALTLPSLRAYYRAIIEPPAK